MTGKQFEDLKNKIETIKSEKARAEGAMAENLVLLREEFGVKTIEDAKSLLLKNKKKLEKTEKEIEDLYSEIISEIKGYENG